MKSSRLLAASKARCVRCRGVSFAAPPRPALFQAIELKRSRRIDRPDLSALRAFGEDYPEAELLLLSLGAEPLLIDGIRCLPLESWLRELRP
jgi:hypothetical protein